MTVRDLELVGVYRRCDKCGELKALEHYLRYTTGRGHELRPLPGIGYRVCASCRGRLRRKVS